MVSHEALHLAVKLPRHEDSSPPHKVRLKKLWYGARARVDSVGNLTTEFTQESVPPTKSAADISADQSRRRTRIERKCLLYEMKENNPASAVGRTRQKQNRSRSNSKRAVRRPRVRWVGLRTRQKQNRSRRSNSKRSSPHSGEKKCLQKRDRHTRFIAPQSWVPEFLRPTRTSISKHRCGASLRASQKNQNRIAFSIGATCNREAEGFFFDWNEGDLITHKVCIPLPPTTITVFY